MVDIPEATAQAIARAKCERRRVIAVGTTTTRALESRAAASDGPAAGSGWAGVFILPGHAFRVVDALFTNFHLPQSTLLRWSGLRRPREELGRVREAVRRGYRFYSYGDAMLIGDGFGGNGAVDCQLSPRRSLRSLRTTRRRPCRSWLLCVSKLRRRRTRPAPAACTRLTASSTPRPSCRWRRPGSVKGITPAQLREIGASIVLSNAYHLALRPGAEAIQALGGLHRFMGWDGPILTDSGGYQIFSLEGLRKVTDDGVAFQSHLDGSRLFLSPEDVVGIQVKLGVDLLMPLDECLPAPPRRPRRDRGLSRTIGWLRRSLAVPLRAGPGALRHRSGRVFAALRRKAPRLLSRSMFRAMRWAD